MLKCSTSSAVPGWFAVTGFYFEKHNRRGALAPLLLLVCLAFLPALSAPDAALALGSQGVNYTAGFRTMSLWDEQKDIRLEVGIWYPAQREESSLNLQDWSLSVARNAKEAPGLFPLVLLSHDAGGGMAAYHDTAADLARQGLVVAAPTHNLDNFADSSGMFKPGRILDRPAELAFVLSGILGANSLSFIDHTRIALMGVGTGAATALTLAGGLPDFASYWDYCAGSGASEPYCSSLAQERMREISYLPDAYPELPRLRVSALVLAAPAYGMLFPRAALTAVRQPALIFAVKTDSLNGAAAHAEMLSRNLPAPPKMIRLNEDAADLLAPCADSVIDFDGLICRPPDLELLEQRYADFNIPLAAFLKSRLGGPLPAPGKAAH